MIVCVPYLMAIQEGTILLKTTDYDNEKDTYYSEHIKLKYEMGIWNETRQENGKTASMWTGRGC